MVAGAWSPLSARCATDPRRKFVTPSCSQHRQRGVGLRPAPLAVRFADHDDDQVVELQQS
ncbi:MAG: hypothetical protein CMJ63_01950 [Planctomycetaceae bacterium]|nr:hypothetical protein [Planctomycetaceae bacterium]